MQRELFSTLDYSATAFTTLQPPRCNTATAYSTQIFFDTLQMDLESCKYIPLHFLSIRDATYWGYFSSPTSVHFTTTTAATLPLTW